MPKQTAPTLSPLPGIRFIEVSGTDAETFLNAQLSRDVAESGSNRGTLSAWHDSRGRVLALLRALRNGDQWLLMAHGGDPDTMIRKLTVFVLRADVALRDASAEWRGGAVLGDVDAWLERRGASLGSRPGDATREDDVFLIRVSPEMAYLVAPIGASAKIESELSMANGPEGDLAEIRSGLVELSPELAARFLPQMLNLDRLGALAFDKGCYPGQEVIARIQNLGNVKRRLFRFSGPLHELPPVGSAIIDTSGVEVGEIVRAARAATQRVEFLGVIRVDAVEATLACIGEPQTPLAKERLPGEEPTPPA